MLEDKRLWEDPIDFDKPKEECGVFGIISKSEEAGKAAYFGLFALQHRGQESAGIATFDGNTIKLHKDMGLVAEVFNEQILSNLKGNMGIGHVRYSTTGSSLAINAQPLVFRYSKGMLALAHNGNLTNVIELRKTLTDNGSIFQTSTDSEILVNLLARHCQNSMEEAIMKSMIDIKGAYSVVVMTENKLIGFRDPNGVRPLCIGKLEDGYVLASESCALDIIGAEFIRDVEPGEIVVLTVDEITSINTVANKKKCTCVFEYIYFARPDSNIDNYNVNFVRRAMGRQLAREYPVDADVVISVPDSGTAAAKGYAEESGIPFEEGLIKNRYIGRTFIQPTQKMREQGVRLKLNPIRQVVEGKRVVMVDDSIVRGTTSGKIVQLLKEAGAKEIHMLVSSPPIIFPCYYGIDTSCREELIAVAKSVDGIREFIGADGLHYLSLEGLLSSFNEAKEGFCSACFSGDYPIEIPREGKDKYNLE